MARVDHPDLIAVIEEGIEQVIVLDAGQGKESADAARNEGAHYGFASGNSGHMYTPCLHDVRLVDNAIAPNGGV